MKKETSKKKKTSKKKMRIYTVVSFFMIPVILLSGSLIAPDREKSEKENRSLAQRPEISFSSVTSGDFMTRFETYLSDQIIGREQIVSTRSAVEILTGKTEQNDVYIGRKSWLFEKQSRYEEKTVSKTLDAVSGFCENCGIKNQLFVLVPNSTAIVTKRLPLLLSPESQSEQIDKIYSVLSQYVSCFDAYKILSKAQNKDVLYYRTDHHWTSSGAKLVFDGIARAWDLNTSSVKYEKCVLSNTFFGTLSSSSGIRKKPDIIETYLPENCAGTYVVKNADEKSKSNSLFKLDKLNSASQYEVFLGGNFSKIVVTTTADTDKKLLLFKDSYANCMLPLLTPYFKEIDIIDPRYFTEEIDTVIKGANFTHLMFLYNVNTFLEDTSLKDII